MVRNSDLRRAFESGTTGISNDSGSMKVVEARNGDSLLVGYDHAIYAERDAETGRITVHEGWVDWAYEQDPNAEATPRHIRNLQNYADDVTERTPSAASTPESVREIGRFGLRE